MLESGLALLREGGGTTNRRDEVDVTAAAHTTRGNHHTLAWLCEIGEVVHGLHGVGVKLPHHGSHGNAQNQVLARLAVTSSPLAMRTTGGAEVMLVAIVNQRGELRVTLKDDVAAVAAISAVGAALGNKGLTTKRHAAGTAISALHVDMTEVCEC